MKTRTGGSVAIAALHAMSKSDLPPLQRFVFIALAKYADGNGVCWPALPTIAVDTGLSRRAVFNAVAGLESRGWMSHESRRRDDCRYDSNLYRLAVERLYQQPSARGAPGPSAPDALGPSARGASAECTSRHEPSARGALKLSREGSREGSTLPRSARRGVCRPASADTQKVLDTYRDAFTSARGEAPPLGPAETKAAESLLTKFKGDTDKACAVIARALSDDFYSDKATLQMVAANPARFVGRAKAKRHGQVQPAAANGEAPCWNVNEVGT